MRVNHIIACFSHAYLEYVQGIAKWDTDLRMYLRPSLYSRTVDYSEIVWC